MTTYRSRATYVALLLVTVLLGSCAQPFNFNFDDDSDDTNIDTDGPVAVTVRAESFTLAWDPPADAVSGYDVFYRSRGSESWVQLADVAASGNPSYLVSTSSLSYGTYEFAVASYVEGEGLSDYHTSLDSSADPGRGWYLEWLSG
ncbi:MAG: hypothetical protein GVY14_07420 [Spirochaetes bacterium]|nr:hypothetical protein [Spirochaetota bacterium]